MSGARHRYQSGAGTRGHNPTIVSYNAGVVKIYYHSISLVRFETKNIFFCPSVVVVN
jgi:hypothetical protein